MARAMPPRPPAGGRQPPRRAGGAKPPPKQPPRQPPKPPPKQPARPGQPGKTAKQTQTRQAAEAQRRAAAKNAAQRQQHRLRQQQFLHEAYGEQRTGEAEQLTERIEEQVRQLETILSGGLSRSARIDLDALYRSPPTAATFEPGGLGSPAREPVWEEFAPGGLASWAGGRARRQRALEAAREAFEDAQEQWRIAEQERQEQLVAAERAHQLRVAEQREEIEQYNSRVARVAAGLRTREPAVVESFLRTVLRRVPLPAGFPDRAEVSYQRAEEWVTLRLVLPDRAVVPVLSGYDYRATSDDLVPVPRQSSQVRDLYRRVLAQVALLVVRDVIEAEPGLSGVSLQGLVDRVDPASGEPAFACVLRLSTDRAGFEALDLAGTPPQECLRTLGAEVSADPYARQPLDQPATEPA